MIDLSPFGDFTGATRDGLQVSLRPMVADDEPWFRQHYAAMRGAELAATPWTESERRAFCDQQYTLQDRHYRAHYQPFLPLAIGVGTEGVGRYYLGGFDSALIIMDIIVASPWQRRGIATLLVTATTRIADEQRLRVGLHVEPDNPVRALYEKLGFVAVGEPGIYQEMVRRAGGER